MTAKAAGSIVGRSVMIEQYRSEVLAAARKAGLIPSRKTCKFDEMWLTPVRDMTQEDIRALRLCEQASEAVLARHLNATTGLVSQRKRGEKRPCGTSLKLFAFVAKNGLGAVA
ncbi:MAG: transcriptional regulator [Rhodobacteraceae bacterium]|nr:transcriptional regulator [Paracoccaceae bacterium]